MSLLKLKTTIAKELFGETAEEAQEKGSCIQCKEPALANCYSDAGVAEYQISGLCEQCFDSMFGEEEEEAI